ncbi:MAG TPA: transcription-repair coupling factor [Melioribacteraceae bacterium]|nr:transcription-repair coupling factor [Melioribacteraceae bacterium]
MAKELLNIFSENKSTKLLQNLINGANLGQIIYTSNFPGSSKNLLINYIYQSSKQYLVLYPSIIVVNEAKVEFNILGLGEKLIVFDDLNLEPIQENLTKLSNKKDSVILAPYELLNVKLPPKKRIDNKTILISTGSNIKYDEILEYFDIFDYKREKFVDSIGDFAIRGSIIDFWSFSEKHPVRLEFDGDFIESVRYFEPDSQRSLKSADSVTLAERINEEAEELTADIFDFLTSPIIFSSTVYINEFLADSYTSKIEPAYESEDIDEELKQEIFEGKSIAPKNENFKTQERYAYTFEELVDRKNAIWVVEDNLNFFSDRIDFNLSEAPVINSNFKILFASISEYIQKDYRILITVENELQGRRITELLSGENPQFEDLTYSGKIAVKTLPIKKGFVALNNKTVVYSDYHIFNKPYRTKITPKLLNKKSKVKDFAAIKKGDFVVHETFGIGQYAGLETIKIGTVEQESIKINYDEGAVVYVNLNYLSLVKKFSSREDVTPKLTNLGTNEWKNAKKKVKSKIADAAKDLIKLYAERRKTHGYAFSPDTVWQKELEASFLYEDTPDQSKVTEEVKSDMESYNPMDRLVCGDVGFGKTEIAVRAAFKAVSDGKQVAILVPTTILAEQHFNTFIDRLNLFPVKIAVLSRFQTKTEQKEIITQIAAGLIDIVIGTHRLLSKDVNFKDLGLLIIDEEHRFGVMAKEKLRTIKANVDTLTLTATPIPRTLNLSLLGARDLSIIATPPPNRQPIYTKVAPFDIVKIREWVSAELRRGGQVYFIHDRVQSIDKITLYLKKHIPGINIGIAHGQMKPADLEKVIYEFLNKKYQILVATKIIESGIDIPNVNTIIINRADRFGLAELHQLRGRVGRSDKQAYAFLLVPSMDAITKKSIRRLQAIEEYTELGTGFNLSMRDLEIRGAGNLLGTEQSGAIDSVGFDMYMKLLDEAVEELKTGEFSEEFKDLPKHLERLDTNIDTYFELGLPKTYMSEQADRLSFYTALFSIVKIDEIEEIKEEMVDRFGKIPPPAQRLILAATLKYYASFALFEKIIILKNKVVIYLPKGNNNTYYTEKFPIVANYIVSVKSVNSQFKNEKDVVKLEFTHKFLNPEEILNFLINFCIKIKEILK